MKCSSDWTGSSDPVEVCSRDGAGRGGGWYIHHTDLLVRPTVFWFGSICSQIKSYRLFQTCTDKPGISDGRMNDSNNVLSERTNKQTTITFPFWWTETQKTLVIHVPWGKSGDNQWIPDLLISAGLYAVSWDQDLSTCVHVCVLVSVWMSHWSWGEGLAHN